MGRLTLNVLLSFAQFEREVTGERIRDKIAASKAKGLWMGGLAPLGYDLPASGTRVLQVNEAEAATVRHIFERYLAIGSVHRLLEELERGAIRSKQRVTAKGKVTGGQRFSRGAMFHLLQNRVYVGDIVHKGQRYPGEHSGIVDPDLFDRVQALLARQQKERRRATAARSPYVGKLFDAEAHRLTPTHSKGASGSIYRYYVPTRLQQGQRATGNTQRYPARRIDDLLGSLLRRIGSDAAADQLLRVELAPTAVEITLPSGLRNRVRQAMEETSRSNATTISCAGPFQPCFSRVAAGQRCSRSGMMRRSATRF